MYYSISKYNVKSCNCCELLCTNTTITSFVSGRTFSVINAYSDLDLKSENLICFELETLRMLTYNMLGQTCRN